MNDWEEDRLAALHKLGILDTQEEARFDNIVELARVLFDVPIALVSLVDRDRQWFKARCGLGVQETTRDVAFCAYAIHEDEVFIVENAFEDVRFRDNPLVTGDPKIRFYAGAVLKSATGFPLGTLCILDRKPRILSRADQTKLMMLARFVASEINLDPLAEAPRQRARLAARIDPLSGLYEAGAFKNRLHDLMTAQDGPVRYSLILVQFMNLTAIKQRFRSSVAGEVVIGVSERILRVLGSQVALGGQVGDNRLAFVVDTPSLKEGDMPSQVAEAAIASVETTVGPISPSANFYVLDCGQDADAVDESLLVAEEVNAGSSGERLVQVPRATIEQARQKIRITRKIGDALAKDKFALHYQPKICGKTMRVTGFEALIRWWDDEFGPIPPYRTIEAVEAAGLVNEFTLWTIRKACSDLAEIRRVPGFGALTMAINIPSEMVGILNFAEQALDAMKPFGLPGGAIEFEILENSLVDTNGVALQNIGRLSQEGITFAIDDFGTGYSCLAYIAQLPLNALKIDRSFVKNLSGRKETDALTHSIITIASDAGLVTVVEGVETEQQLSVLRNMGCDKFQGFLFSPAVPRDEAVAMLQTGRCFDALLEGEYL